MARRKQTYRLMAAGLVFLLGLILAAIGSALNSTVMVNTGLAICVLGGIGMLAVKALAWLKRHSRSR